MLLSLLRWFSLLLEPIAENAISPNDRLISLLFSPHSEALGPLPNFWERESTGPAWTRCLSLVPSITEGLGVGLFYKLTKKLYGGQRVTWIQVSWERTSSCSKAEASHLETSLLLTSQRAALASRSMAVIDFALEDFMTLLEIIKKTNIKFSQTKSIAFLFPPAYRGSLPFL